MLIKQPNGKYSYMKDDKIITNLLADDYVSIKKQEAKTRAIKELQECSDSPVYLIENYNPSDEELKSMGYEKTYDEMIKYIPKKVTHRSYSGRDCTEYGKCPTCGNPVMDGIGHTDKVCRNCNQTLKW